MRHARRFICSAVCRSEEVLFATASGQRTPARIEGGRVSNPDFYPMLRGLGFNNLPDQSATAAITFSDTIVAHATLSDGQLFHELVHVEQYRRLGIPAFAELYVRGFLAGGSYDAIPLEVNAYTLDGRFRRQPDQGFSVEDEVGAWVRDSRF